ncbi:hypothetical protein KABACHOK_03050 [Brevundimonas phage vB_BpoS-Kabachok]|uniref:Uncharacterized protein n=1 Tax=Brevundimonas phage vB_BpoS-Kabachok TaxID=2948600 RepID=A0A9E7SJX7_9CAUD|nr:hypothetical protein KABACHOK_03050 [Brevundimonas phage vB_BpoS-Kabachok]
MANLDAEVARLPPRLQAAHAQGYMVTDDLEGFPIDNAMRFRVQVFSPRYGWVNAWSTKGELHADTPERLISICNTLAAHGDRVRIIELVPSLYRTFEPE